MQDIFEILTTASNAIPNTSVYSLYRTLRSDRVEEEATRIQQERLTAEEENRTLRETVFDSQGRARAAEAALKRVQAEAADRDKQLRIMTDQNAELLRLLEQEEVQTARLSAANEVRMFIMVYYGHLILSPLT